MDPVVAASPEGDVDVDPELTVVDPASPDGDVDELLALDDVLPAVVLPLSLAQLVEMVRMVLAVVALAVGDSLLTQEKKLWMYPLSSTCEACPKTPFFFHNNDANATFSSLLCMIYFANIYGTTPIHFVFLTTHIATEVVVTFTTTRGRLPCRCVLRSAILCSSQRWLQ